MVTPGWSSIPQERLFQYGKLAQERRKRDEVYASVVPEPGVTADGSDSLMANVEGAHEMDQVLVMNADGIGLFRTEGIFRHHGYPPEAIQYEEYMAVAKAAGDAPVVIRTLDGR